MTADFDIRWTTLEKPVHYTEEDGRPSVTSGYWSVKGPLEDGRDFTAVILHNQSLYQFRSHGPLPEPSDDRNDALIYRWELTRRHLICV